MEKLSRVEVIDHREGVEVARVFVATDVTIELSYQDDGKTLKVFIADREPNA